MVSKVAVIALVAIVACPILLGYAMNLNEVTETGYRLSGESMNITEQLYNGNTGSEYTYAHGDITKMNTVIADLHDSGGVTYTQRIPEYEQTTTQKGSYPLFKTEFNNVTYDSSIVNIPIYSFYYYYECETTVDCDVYGDVNGTLVLRNHYDDVKSIYVFHNKFNMSVYGSFCIVKTIDGNGFYTNKVINDIWTAGFKFTGSNINAYEEYVYINDSDNTSFADLSAGFHFASSNKQWSAVPGANFWNYIDLPDYTKQMTYTMNLDSITAANYSLHISIAPENIIQSTLPHTYITMNLAKTTVGSEVKWTLTNEYDSSAPVTELYLDPELSDNTYQFTITADSIYDESTSKYYLVVHVRVSYVGSWPTLIGIANPYLEYDLDYVIRDDPAFIYNTPISSDDLTYQRVYFHEDNNGRTPIMRFDDTLYRAFQYKTITNRTFLPTVYKQNPAITLNKISLYGDSITFGGNTYAVTNGSINVNGTAMKLNGLTFNTELNDNGNYENKIGGVLVSTTASDPGMTFGGSWVASVTVQSAETYTYTKTEWTAGQFAWDGLDHNFLIVGLLTSLGAFIALGIYIRRTKASLWPLLIVCGGAALLFFVML